LRVENRNARANLDEGFFYLPGITRFWQYFDGSLDLRPRLFNLFAFVGALIGLCVVASNVVTGSPPVHIALNLASSALAVFLLWYANRTGRFELCYVITIIVVFLVFFPVLFFTAGGYHSGIPSFFVFAVTCTAMMLRGKKMFLFCAVELLLYCGICLVEYLRPTLVTPFASEKQLAFDVATGFVLASFALVFSMAQSFRVYDEQTDKLRTANSAKTAFLANMSHEIRTPLNVILGMNEMIRSITASGPVANWSGEIQAAGETLRELIDELLDISKIEAGKEKTVAVEYLVSEMIHELILVGEQETRKRGLEFRIQADPDMPSKLCGDFSRVRQVVTNFLVNAAASVTSP
jgi:signal transduction histidine kinase